MGKGEIARNKQFLLLPQCFYPFGELFSIFIQFEIVVFKLFFSLDGSKICLSGKPHLGGSVVSMWDSLPGGCECDARLRRLFALEYFRHSPLQKHVRKVVGGFGKKISVSTGVRKPGKTYASPTAMI